MSMRYAAGFISAFYNPLKNPNAPTIGTATGGNTSASVTFTAPSNVGGSAITSYTVISTPSGITASGSSSPVSVTGLTNGTAYTFKVFATNSYGPSVLSAASNSVTPSSLPVAIGAAFGGGYLAGQISTAGNGIADYNLVIGPQASAQITNKQWKIVNTTTAGTSSVINGPANSAAMNDITHPAAQFCEAVTAGSQTDWYMPARNELEILYYNLKPSTTSNYTGIPSGINANAVPARASAYTAGTPAQTSATVFQIGNAEALLFSGYWASTEGPYATKATSQGFGNGYQSYAYSKNNYLSVRAVRRVAV